MTRYRKRIWAALGTAAVLAVGWMLYPRAAIRADALRCEHRRQVPASAGERWRPIAAEWTDGGLWGVVRGDSRAGTYHLLLPDGTSRVLVADESQDPRARGRSVKISADRSHLAVIERPRPDMGRGDTFVRVLTRDGASVGARPIGRKRVFAVMSDGRVLCGDDVPRDRVGNVGGTTVPPMRLEVVDVRSGRADGTRLPTIQTLHVLLSDDDERVTVGGKLIAPPLGEGTFVVRMSDGAVLWRLPYGHSVASTSGRTHAVRTDFRMTVYQEGRLTLDVTRVHRGCWPVLSPSGHLLVFEENRCLRVFRTDSGQETRIAAQTGRAFTSDRLIVSDSERIAVVDYPEGTPESLLHGRLRLLLFDDRGRQLGVYEAPRAGGRSIRWPSFVAGDRVCFQDDEGGIVVLGPAE